MAKGTLHASAGTTKKGGVASRASTKNGKSSIVGSQDSSTGATSKKAKTSTAASKKSTVKKEQKPAVSEESDNDDIQFVERDHQRKDGAAAAGPRHLDVKGKTYDKHYKAVVRDALEGMPLLYPDEQDKVETILKLFDLEPEYGPAAGMTRLERWQRAANWGLDPPAEVYEILTTIEGGSKEKYRESLFYSRV